MASFEASLRSPPFLGAGGSARLATHLFLFFMIMVFRLCEEHERLIVLIATRILVNDVVVDYTRLRTMQQYPP